MELWRDMLLPLGMRGIPPFHRFFLGIDIGRGKLETAIRANNNEGWFRLRSERQLGEECASHHARRAE
jgi:hypothetical protein